METNDTDNSSTSKPIPPGPTVSGATAAIDSGGRCETSDINEACEAGASAATDCRVDETAEKPVQNMVQAPQNGPGTWADAWSQLQKQQSEFEKRTAQLQMLRQRLEKHLHRGDVASDTRKDIPKLRQAKNGNQSAQSAAPGPTLPQTCRAGETGGSLLQRTEAELTRYDSDGPGLTRSPSGQLDEIAVEYRQSIATLLQERFVIEQRMVELQRQVTKRDFGQDNSPVQTVARGARRLLDWKFGVASLLGLAIAGLLFVRTESSYHVDVVIAADSDRLSPAQAAAQRVELAEAVAAHTLASDSAALFQSPVSVTAADTHRFQLGITTADPEKGIMQFQDLVDRSLAVLKTTGQRSIAGTRATILRVQSDLTDAQEEFAQLIRLRSDERLAIRVDNPKEELQRLSDRIGQIRKEFESMQAEITQAQARLQVLGRTEIPEFPEVDDSSRRRAEQEDRYLRSDLEGLRMRLRQLRTHLLEVFPNSGKIISAYGAASAKLSTFLESAKLKLGDAEIADALVQLGTHADRLHRLTIDFEERWQQYGRDLQQMTIDPRRKECLEMQRGIEDLTRRFNFDTNEVLKDLQLEYQQFTRTISAPAELFQLRHSLVKEINHLVENQRTFADFSRRILPTSDLHLSNILHSVVGLTRRVQDRRAALEAELSLATRKRLSNELSQQTTRQETELAQLVEQRDLTFANFLSLQRQQEQLLPYIEAYGATATVIRYDEESLNKLSARIEQLQHDHTRLREELAVLENTAEALKIDATFASNWPVNLFERLATIGFGSILATSGGYLLLVLLSRAGGAVLGRSTPRQPA